VHVHENLADHLESEELDVSDVVEHGGLAHPLGQGQELGEELVFAGLVLLVDDYAVHGDREPVALGFGGLAVGDVEHAQVVGSIFPFLGEVFILVLLFAGDELDGVVETIPSEECDALLTGGDVDEFLVERTFLVEQLLVVLEHGVLVAQFVDVLEPVVQRGQLLVHIVGHHRGQLAALKLHFQRRKLAQRHSRARKRQVILRQLSFGGESLRFCILTSVRGSRWILVCESHFIIRLYI